MRLRITYSIDKIPLDYRGSFVSLIKEAVKTADEQLFEKLYNSPGRITKPFCFSVFFRDVALKGEFLEIKDNIQLSISMTDLFTEEDGDRHIAFALFNGLRAPDLKKFSFPEGRILKRLDVRLMEEKQPEHFWPGVARFKTLSPIMLTNGAKNAAKPVLHPSTKDPRRENSGRTNAIFDEDMFRASMAMSLKGHVDGEVFFEPDNLKVEVIHHTIGDYVRNRGVPLKLVCFSGSFKLRGLPRDLHRIYQTGIGFKRNQGFGMLEVI